MVDCIPIDLFKQHTVTLTVGMPVSLSGQFQVQGRQTLAGLEAWARDVNRQYPGSVQIVHHDDTSDRSTVKDVTRHLIVNDQVDILIGPYSSVLTSAAAEVSEAHSMLLWNQGGASDDVYNRGYRWIVGVLTPASRYLAGLLPLVRNANSTASTIALVRASTGEFPQGVCSGVAESAEGQGFEIVLSTKFSASAENFASAVDELKSANPDVIVIAGRVRNDLNIADQLVASGIGAGAVVAVAAGIQQFKDHLGVSADRFVGPSQWEAVSNCEPDFGPSVERVVASLKNGRLQHIDYPMAQAYAAGLVVERCLLEANSCDSSVLRKAATTLRFSTFYGNFEIDGQTGRQVGRETLLVQWQQGRKMVVWPPDQARAALVYPWR